MRTRRCARCDGTNVDYAGYCWDCEYQQRFVAPTSPLGAGSAPAAASPAPRRGAAAKRFLTMIVAPAVTIVLVGCGFASVLVFERADALVGARSIPSAAAPSSSATGGGSAAACVVGTWRRTSVDTTETLAGRGAFHATGGGGTLTLGPDGSGSFDSAGLRETGIVDGTTVTLTASGVETFRYRVSGGTIVFEGVTGTVTGVLEAHGQRLWEGALAREQADFGSDLGCGGTVLTLSFGRRVAGADGSETYTRIG